jgi:hypothetical protein
MSKPEDLSDDALLASENRLFLRKPFSGRVLVRSVGALFETAPITS